MTRTDVVASSRPQAADAGKTGPTRSWRRRLVLPMLVLAVALAAPTAALAAEEGLSTYNETKTSTSSTSAAKPKSSTAPAESSAPAKELPKTSTLPFTGLNLGNVVVVGFLLIGAGVSIVVVQRRQRGRADS